METVLILTFAALAIIFLVLWLISYSRDESYGQLAKEVRGINDTLNRLVFKMPAPQVATEKKEEVIAVPEEGQSKPVTIESVRTALRFNGIAPVTRESDEPETLYFTFNGQNYRIFLGGLPFITVQLAFGLSEEKKCNIEMVKEVAMEVSHHSYGAHIYVDPDMRYTLIEADLYADTYLYLRNNIRFYVGVVENTAHYFFEHFEELQKERDQSSKDAINNALIAAQNEMAGKKIPS